jgi:site-specific recombinase XerD
MVLNRVENNNSVDFIIRKIAKESPQLKDLNNEQLEQIAKIVITQRLTKEMDEKANIADIDIGNEINLFIQQGTSSIYTKAIYRQAIATLTRWARKNQINILLMSYAQADDFVYSLTGAPKTVRLKIAAISSFYSFLERRHSAVKNPIRGTKARPPDKTIKPTEIPTDDEVQIIIDSLPELEKLAVVIMCYRGLRVGALNKLKVWGNSFSSVSKGKEIFGEFSDDIIAMLKKSSLNYKIPFCDLSTNALKIRIIRATQKLHKQGKINAPYSCHDLRHFFAVSNYLQDKDIYRLSKLLDHSNIAITQTYLKALKIAV